MKKLFYVLGVAVGLGGLWFLYYTISPFFIDIRVDEAAPEAQTLPSVMVAGAPLVGTAGHPASGTVRLVETDGKWYVRYENFKTINGPDLYVYLAQDLEAREYINLGRLRATEGNVNYEVPTGVNPTNYRYALIWCKQFGVLFNSAALGRAN